MDEPDGWRASLVIMTDAWPSTRLIDAIGLTPDRAWDRGQLRSPADGRAKHRYGGVAYRSPLAEPADIQNLLDSLLARLAPYKERIAAIAADLMATPDATGSIGVRLVVPTQADAQGLHFSHRQLRGSADLGADLGVTVEFWGEAAELPGCSRATGD